MFAREVYPLFPLKPRPGKNKTTSRSAKQKPRFLLSGALSLVKNRKIFHELLSPKLPILAKL
jgi:hypothetical protein